MVSSEVSRARTTSTSFITGAGLKKWMPQKFQGRSRTLAMPVMGMVEVFDAMTVVLGEVLLDGAEDLGLDARVLVDGLDDHLTRAEAVVRVDGCDQPADSVDRRFVHAPVLHAAHQPLAGVGDGLLGLARPFVGQHGGKPRLRDHLGDAAAHLARANHSDRTLDHQRLPPAGARAAHDDTGPRAQAPPPPLRV